MFQQKNSSGSGPLATVIIFAVVLAFIASFFLAGEGDVPGEFYISRQAMWGDGKYYVKLTFMLTLFTLIDLVAVPVLIFAGLGSVFRPKPWVGEPPPSWDVSQIARKVKQVVLFLVLSALWAAFTGLSLFAPQMLKPIGFLASTLLLIIPMLPLFNLAVLFDALAPMRYIEGNVQSVALVNNRNNVTAHLVIADENLQTTPLMATGLVAGVRASALVSGFFNSVLRLEKRQS